MGIEEVANATGVHGHAALGVAGGRRGRVFQAEPRDGTQAVAWVRDGDGSLLAESEDLAAEVEDSGDRAGLAHRSRRLVERPALAPCAFVDAGPWSSDAAPR